MDSNSISLPAASRTDTSEAVPTGPQMDQLQGALDAAGTAAAQQGVAVPSKVVPEGAPGATSVVMTGDTPAMANQAALQPNGDVRPPVKMLQTMSLADMQTAAKFVATAQMATNNPESVSLVDVQQAAVHLSPTALKIATSTLAAKPGVASTGTGLGTILGTVTGSTTAGVTQGAAQIAQDGLAAAVAFANNTAPGSQANGGMTPVALAPVAGGDANPVIMRTAADTAAPVETIMTLVPGATTEVSKIAATAAVSAANAKQMASLTDGSAPKTAEQSVSAWATAFNATYNAWLLILSPRPLPRVGCGPSQVMVGGTQSNGDGPTSGTNQGGQTKPNDAPSAEVGNGSVAGTVSTAAPGTQDGTASSPLPGVVLSNHGGDTGGCDTLDPQPVYPSIPSYPSPPLVPSFENGPYGSVQPGCGLPPAYPALPTSGSLEQQQAAVDAWNAQQEYQLAQYEAAQRAYVFTMITASLTMGNILSSSNSAYEADMRPRTAAIALAEAQKRETEASRR